MEKLKINPLAIAFIAIGFIIIGLLDQLLYLARQGKVLVVTWPDRGDNDGGNVAGTVDRTTDISPAVEGVFTRVEPAGEPIVERGPGGRFRKKEVVEKEENGGGKSS